MINFDDIPKENVKEHNPNCLQISDHLYRILVTGSSWSGKMKSLFNLINYQPDIYMLKVLMKQNKISTFI